MVYASRRLLVGIAFALLIAVGASPAVSFAQAGGVGGRPANPRADEPRSQSIFIYTLDKGQAKSDEVLINNSSSNKRTIDIYAVDGIVTNTGAFTCAQRSEMTSGAGSWIDVDTTRIELDAGATRRVPFKVTTPSDAEVGERNSCIVIQDADEMSASGDGVRLQTRQAIRVAVTLPGDLRRDVRIERYDVTSEVTMQTYTLELRNDGNVSADVDATVHLKSVFGNEVYQNGGSYPVLADQALELSFSNDERPLFGGWYTTYASIEYDRRAGVFGTSSGGDTIRKQTDTRTIFLAPTGSGIAIIGSGVILVVVGIGMLIIAARRRNATVASSVSYTVVPGDSIQSIADAHHIGWKKLAGLNNIKAPYTLKPGQNLRVPTKSSEAPRHLSE